MPNLPFDTNQPAQVQGLEGYEVDPIFTVGDTIESYTPPGILDGTGAYELDDNTVRILANHELSNTVGYQYTLANGTQLPGARVSYFDIDKRTLQVVDAGLAFDTIYNRAGEVVDAATDLEYLGLNRLCSANLMEAEQFGTNKGFVDTIFFTGEEASGGTEFALDVATQELWAVPWLGRAAWESVAEVDTGTTDKIALLVGDDRSSATVNGVTVNPVAPVLLYVGTKDTSADANFLERNGLADGKLYVWVADDQANASDAIEISPAEFFATGANLNGKFVEIDIYNPTGVLAVDGADNGTSIQDGELGYDSLGFATQGQQDQMAIDAKAFRFARPEDVATNPNDGTQVVLASTGNGSAPENDTWGTTYLFDINFNNIATGDITANVEILYAGDDSGNGVFSHPDEGLRSPDNLDWADDGFIYLQEDDAVDATPNFGGTSGEEASIWRLDPAAVNPAATLTRVAQVDRTAVPATQTDSSSTDIGNWETSGILDVSTLFGAKPGELLIFDVQAHSLRDGSIITATNLDGNGDGTKTRQENLVEGGQLSFLIAPDANLPQDSSLVTGSTSGADTIEAKITPGFDGINDIVFSGAGDDTVDVAVGGALTGFNRINLGSGKDTVIVSDGDRANGGSGDDYFDAITASKYRLSGGKGDDIFDLGMDGRAIGGEGDDQFYVGEGGDNLLSGGAGADQFWLLTGDVPETANIVVDFTQGTDVLGIAGQGAGVNFASLTRTGNSISLNGDVFATLNGFDTATLTAADFVFI